MYTLVHGDCLEKLQDLPSSSVDLVLTDPPYGTLKGLDISAKCHNKQDTGRTAWDTIINSRELFKQLLRVVKYKGQIILFSQEPYTSHLRSQSFNGFTFCYPMVWVKNQFGNPLSAKKAMLNYFEDLSLWVKDSDTDLNSPLRCYFRTLTQELDLNIGKVNKMFNHRKYEHTFYFNSVQFELCNERLYNELVERLDLTKHAFYKPYRELVALKGNKVKTFNLNGKGHLSNVLCYQKPVRPIHPTQKPVPLLWHLIETFSNRGDLVLDFAMGSGSTGEACINTNRDFVGIEKDKNYFDLAHKRLKNHVNSIAKL